MNDWLWTAIVVFTSSAYYFLGYNRGKLLEIQTRIERDKERTNELLRLLHEEQEFMRDLAEHFGVKVQPRHLRVVPPEEQN